MATRTRDILLNADKYALTTCGPPSTDERHRPGVGTDTTGSAFRRRGRVRRGRDVIRFEINRNGAYNNDLHRCGTLT